MNLIVADGNLVGDVEERRSRNDKVFFTFRLANKNRRNNTNYYNVCAVGTVGEACKKFLRKGSKVVVEGELSIRTSEKDGNSYTYLDLDARNVVFCNQSSTPKDEVVPQQRQYKDAMTQIDTDEDVPF